MAMGIPAVYDVIIQAKVIMMERKHPVQLFSVSDCAQFLGVSTKTIWRLIHSGKLPMVRVRRRVLVSEEALLRFVAQQDDLPSGAALRKNEQRRI